MILKNYKSVLFLFLCFVQCAIAQNSSAFQDFIHSNALEDVQLSVYAENVSSEKELDKYFEETALIPASNVKLFTTALAWELLGPDFTFDTQISIEGDINNTGTLMGNLLIGGGGDPTLGSEKWPERSLEAFFDQIIAQLKDKGIRSIEGDVILYTSPWKGEWHHRDWSWEDIGNYYGISSGAINVYENKYKLTFSTTGAVGQVARIIQTEPDLDLTFDNQVVIGPPHSGDRAYIFGDANDENRVIRGSVPKLRSSFTIKGSLPDPEAFFARQLYRELKRNGIEVNGSWSISKNALPRNNELIWVYHSPPLHEIVDHVNSASHNLFAEALYNYIRLNRPFLMDTKMKEWKSLGLDFDKIRWKDGCGLSPFNRFSAQHFVQLLKIMKQEDGFLNSFAAPGKEGTLQYRFGRMDQLQVKTGSIEGVYALSGILGNGKEPKVVFSILINNYYGSTRVMDREIEKLLRSWSKM